LFQLAGLQKLHHASNYSPVSPEDNFFLFLRKVLHLTICNIPAPCQNPARVSPIIPFYIHYDEIPLINLNAVKVFRPIPFERVKFY
jgi:hypothetical protein